MPYKNITDRRKKQKEWVASKRARDRQNKVSIPKSKPKTVGIDKGIDKRIDKPMTAQTSYNKQPTLISTHRWEIRAKRKASQVSSIPNIKIKRKGDGRRIIYGVVELHGCTIEVYRASVRLIIKGDLVNADDARVVELKRVMKSVCAAKGLHLAPEASWTVGEWSHTVMEDNGLNALFMPLAKQNWGDDELHMFLDESHSGKVEMSGKHSFVAADNLKLMLLEFPQKFDEYNKNIVKHLAVLDKMSATLDKIQESLTKKG